MCIATQSCWQKALLLSSMPNTIKKTTGRRPLSFMNCFPSEKRGACSTLQSYLLNIKTQQRLWSRLTIYSVFQEFCITTKNFIISVGKNVLLPLLRNITPPVRAILIMNSFSVVQICIVFFFRLGRISDEIWPQPPQVSS